jgi:DNA (cytosine-5)-methyltransferase 1
MTTATTPLRSIDLFAGVGGIRLGFEQAFGERGIDTVFVSEFDTHAAETYAANFRTPSKRERERE